MQSVFPAGAWEWPVALMAAFCVGTSKTGLSGLGILGIALFTQILPGRSSTGIVLPLLIVADIVAVISFRRHAVWSLVYKLFPVTAVGIVFGALAMQSPYLKSNNSVKILIGAVVVGIVLFTYYRRYQRDPLAPIPESPRTNWPMIVATGLLAGTLTMLANAAGPVMVLYLLAAGLPKNEFLGTGAWLFFLLNLFKVPFSAALGLISSSSIEFDFMLAPTVIAGALMGKWLMTKINQRTFEELTLALTLLSGLNLVAGPLVTHR